MAVTPFMGHGVPDPVANPKGEIFLWLCENGHYLAMSTQGKYPPRMGISNKTLTERHYQRLVEKGQHDNEPCPHCNGALRRRFVVTGLEQFNG